MGRFINGDRPRTSPRSRLNNRISPARFDTPTPQCQQNGERKECGNANDEDQPTSENKPKKKKPQGKGRPLRRSKRRPLRRSQRKLVLMKCHPKLKKRSCRKGIILVSKPGKLQAAKTKNVKKTKK